MDDHFYGYHESLAKRKKIKVISFSIHKKSSMIKLVKVKKFKDKYELFINVNGLSVSFYSRNDNKSNIYNILASLAVINLYKDIRKFKKNIFLNFKIPSGRGDISKVKLKNKNIHLVDETYNSNPLSLKIALENYNKIDSKNSKKFLILGDMLELGKHSIKQHKLISKIVNQTKIDKVYVTGKYIKGTFEGLKSIKKAEILDKNFNIIDLINKNLNNNDYLMIKGSNSTGLNKITNNLKQRSSNVI
jgi:murE/murF fusion protein